MCYIDKLVKNNTGVSSKNFFLVVVTLIGLILLLVPAVLLIIEICYNHTIQTDLNGLAAYIGAVAGVFASAVSIVNHDCVIGEVCHLDAGSVVKSNSTIPAGTKIEAGTVSSFGKETGMNINE